VATSEKADTVASFDQHPFVDVTFSTPRYFNLSAGVTRLHVNADVFVPKGSEGTIEVRLLYLGNASAPVNQTVLFGSFDASSNNYLRENVDAPRAGEWVLLVDYLNAHGGASVTVDAITPTR